ncbi:hypothetical protein TEA_001188 [Camellia sinensis var. sinensis]|uniref:UBC core domain-containing protein n=1 Tax=Camellia sinensis var. sinensis TaxID=542762 RepID=A0A4S4E5I9_CAMSN|nr:hypothetical protein TEA_001188 [Camellia sinensis var. sinensis]
MKCVYLLIKHYVPILPCLLAVYADGSICLDILQNQWSPIYDVAAILTSIQEGISICLFIAQLILSTEEALYLQSVTTSGSTPLETLFVKWYMYRAVLSMALHYDDFIHLVSSYDAAQILCCPPSISSLLCDLNPNSLANSKAARMFSENKREYNRRVREIYCMCQRTSSMVGCEIESLLRHFMVILTAVFNDSCENVPRMEGSIASRNLNGDSAKPLSSCEV